MTADEFYIERRKANDVYENTMKGLWLKALPKEFSVLTVTNGIVLMHDQLAVPIQLDKDVYYVTVQNCQYYLPKDIEKLHSHLLGHKSIVTLKDSIDKWSRQALFKLMSNITNEFNSFPKILAAIVGDGWSYVEAKATDRLEIGLYFKDTPSVFGTINLTNLTVVFPHFEVSIRETDTVLEIANTIVTLWKSSKNQWFDTFLKSCKNDCYDDDWFQWENLLVKLSFTTFTCLIYTTKQAYIECPENPKHHVLALDSETLKNLRNVTSI